MKVGRVPATATLATDVRIAFIDNARAIGIVLVVVGHAPGLPALASNFIFAFHMPLFFLLSGLMVGRSRLQMDTTRRIALLAKSLLLPYLFYFLVSYVYWVALKRHGLRADEFEALPWWHPFIGLLSGSADDLYVDVVLWFLPCLFIVASVHHVASKRLSAAIVAMVFSVIAFAFVMLHSPVAARWWWSSDCAVVGIAFYAIGSASNGLLAHARPMLVHHSATAVAVAIAGFVACVGLVRLTGHVDLNHLAFGDVPSLYLPMGAVGTVATLALSAVLPSSTIARWLSMNTLTIFPLHFLMFSVLTGIALVVFHLPTDFKQTGPIVAVVFAAGALLMCWPTALLLHRALNGYRSLQARVP